MMADPEVVNDCRLCRLVGWRTMLSVILVFWLAIPAVASWRVPREALEHRVVHGEFRIHYSLEGDNAFPVELIRELVAQLDRADRFYRDQLGLTPPLDGSRYRKQQVNSIDIHILKRDRLMGSAGDEPIHYRYRHFSDSDLALTITLSNRWRPPNLTPAHELFHSYQYGYTFFKNAWFLEGMARSLENPFRPGRPVRTEPLPDDPLMLQDLLTRAYKADLFWSRLFLLCDPRCAELPLRNGTYLPPPESGFCGGVMPRAVLEQLRLADRQAEADFGIKSGDWPEAEQRNKRNNPYLLLGLQRALADQCVPLRENSELREFQLLLQQAIAEELPLFGAGTISVPEQ